MHRCPARRRPAFRTTARRPCSSSRPAGCR
jgi:hypothetical protein